ncbi:MAG TPA: hypothetical protein VND91_11765, partial [Candidatus Saccharimonadia bacterium]|nr:hypothetical protein [Candidatus Saccharimonadia bacterium]
MELRIRSFRYALLGAIALSGSAYAKPVTIPVESSNTAAWLRSDGAEGTGMPPGGPGIWNTRFLAAIPPGMTNISFTLDTLLPDDKAVVHLNGGFIADAVVLRANGTAAGPGTFDFGLGAGNQPYT